MTLSPAFDPSLAGQPINLTNCDREPIHIPGRIQPHGCLLACDHSARLVTHHSANLAGMLGLDDGEITGQLLADLLGADNAHRILNALATGGSHPQPSLIFDVQIGARRFDISAHRFDGRAIFEFEPIADNVGSVFSLSRTVLSRLRGLADPDRLIEAAAHLIQAQLGYDRVMIYELGADGAGKVVSEAKRDDLESFLGQYFPASDIPQQARALYLRNPIRVIGDAAGDSVPIEVARPDAAPLDLSYAHLRSVSPIHCEYLRNMGVAASMSVSVIIDGALWGLIACHHYQPKALSMAERATAEVIGEFFALQLDTLRRRRTRDNERAARRTIDKLLVDASQGKDVGAALQSCLPDLARMIEAEGLGMWFGGEWSVLGDAPSRAEVAPLLELVQTQEQKEVVSTASLARFRPGAEVLARDFAGALIVPLSKRSDEALVFFRKEALQTLAWAGDPNKTYESGPHGDRLTPRKSFALWKETVRNTSRPWSEADLRFAEALRSAVVEVLLLNSELLADERARAGIRQRMLNEELNHRVKNILALIQSLVKRRPTETETIGDFVGGLKGRIQALSTAHDQIVRGDNGGRLADLLEGELGPYRDAGTQIRLHGPEVELDARAFSVMALVLHEMATNAAKYGALSRASGRLLVTWSLDPRGDCVLDWVESGVPDIAPPRRKGFGSELIRRSMPLDLGGTSTVEFGPDGLQARFVLPGRFVTPAVFLAPTAAPAAMPREADPVDLAGRCVLIVEDQALIAMSLESDLIDQGLRVCGIAPNVPTALRMVDDCAVDLAILDINLDGDRSLPVAEELLRRGLPFVFATGYGGVLDLPSGLAAVPVVGKPYQIDEILEKLDEAVRAVE